MSDYDDLYDVTNTPITDELAERLLSGSTLEHEAASVAGLDAVFHSLRAPADHTELSGMEAAVTAFRGAVVTPIAGASSARTRPMLKKLLTTKAVATIGVVTLVSAGAAAAATGTVPSPFASDRAREVTSQHVPDIARDNVAKHLDDDDAEATTIEATSTTEATTTTEAITTTEANEANEAAPDGIANGAVGPDAAGPAKFGLCTAFAAHGKHADEDATTSSIDVPVAFRNLTDAAAAAGQTVDEFCADATPGNSDSAPGQGDENPSATAPGHSDENPSGTAPGNSQHGPADIAPGRSDKNPSG
jgi:hypothetical protein